jgi:hypothetical protein
MQLKILGAIGAGVMVIGLVGFAIWQANRLVATGQELGQLRAEKAELERQLTEKVAEVMGLIDSYEFKVQGCLDQVAAAQKAGEIWMARIAYLEEHPITVTDEVTIEATDCTEGLVEGRAIARARIQEVRNAITPP